MSEEHIFLGISNEERDAIFERIIETSPNGIVIMNDHFHITYFNYTAEKFTEKRREDVIGRVFRDIFPQIVLNEEMIAKQSTGLMTINEKKLHTKVFTIQSGGETTAIVFLIQDLSQQFKLTTQLEKSRHIIEELREILECSFDGVLVTDEMGNVLMHNKSYERITGITNEELSGKNITELINPVWMKNSVVLLAAERKAPVSLHHTTRHGKNIIVTGTPVFGKNHEVKKVVVNARDITEIYELQEKLLKAREMEKLYFRKLSDEDCKKTGGDSQIVVSDVMQEIYSLANKVSSFDATVLLTGESGVGKDQIARYIHQKSLRKDKPFVAINCGAIPEQLLESELFGYEKGAFTGSSKEGKPGLLETAEGGTLFLDEIGEMPFNLQVKFLRVLETREIIRVGAIRPVAVDVRLIAATNKNIELRVQNGEFREDLFYRLNVIQINVPPLRERIEDIAPLALHFLKMFNLKYGQNKKLTYDVIKEMEGYPWSGNVRQLKNLMENMVILSNNEYLQVNDLPWCKHCESEGNSAGKCEDVPIIPLQQAVEQLEKQILKKAMEEYRSTRKVAQAVKVDQSTVVRKLKKYGLTTPSDA